MKSIIQGNYIGTDVTGALDLGNVDDGIDISSANNTIGGTTAATRNLISGNGQDGVDLVSLTATSNVVQGNYIGIDATGSTDLGNSRYGVVVHSGTSGNTIGRTATGAGNTIVYNAQAGIGLSNAVGTGNRILGNAIHSNAGIGIDLNVNGVTANDAGDGDTGANNLQNFPVLATAYTTGSLTAVSGFLNSHTSTTFRLEFFANAAADASGHGEAERYLDFREVTTHATTGDAVFTFMISGAVTVGEFLTATATHLATNDTSELALNTTAVAGLDSDSDGVLDIAEDRNLDGDGNPTTGAPLDTDGDSTLDYLDTDDDGDGIPTASEDANGNGDPTDDDTDGDSIPDYLDPDDGLPGPGDSDEDGVGDDVECPSGPPCTDTDGDGIPNYNDPDHNTLVKRLTPGATHDGTGVWIQWLTGWEVDNLGFQVYREVGGQPVQVTPSLLAGSALMAGPKTILPAGHSYVWYDPAGTTLDRYWLVDVALSGARTWHGPFQTRSGSPTTTASHRMPTPLLARLGQQRPAPARVTRPKGIVEVSSLTRVTTPPQPQVWEAPALAPTAVQQSLAAAPALILTIREPGWYRVSQVNLIAAGLDPRINPRHLQLFASGRRRPLYVAGESDGQFDPGDAIAFYGEGLDTPWSDTQAYWLVVGSQPGTRLQQVAAPGQSPPSESFAFTVKHRERTLYIAAIQNGLDENFFGAVIATEPVEQVLQLAHLAPTPPGEAQLVVNLQGITDQTHPVALRFNDHEVGTLHVSGRSLAIGAFTLPQHWLQPGINVVTLAGAGEERHVSLVESVQLTYWRTYTAEDDHLHCTVPDQQTVSLGGFTTNAIRVLDITDPETVHELVGPVAAESEGYRITVTPQRPGERTLFAIGGTQRRSPLALSPNMPSAWHHPDQGADLVIISHGEWINRLTPLQALREQQGWSVALIDVQDLYDERTFGHKDPQAIVSFLRHATIRWQTPPRFVLLVGDASFDPRNYLGQGVRDWIPTTWVNTADMETASDDALADLDGDGVADLAIGRLPVRSAAEADNMVAKLVAYNASEGDWRGRSLVVTDRPGDFDFIGATQPLVQQLSAATAVTTLAVGSTPLDQAREQLNAHLEAGQLLVTYLGHGSVDRWHPEGLLTTSAVYGLTNSPRLPVVLSMTCLNGFFHDLDTETLAEALIRAPTGGAVAVWASSGLTRPTAQVDMQRALVSNLLSDEQPTLGEAIQIAKASIVDPDVRRTWILLGDPTLRLKLESTEVPPPLGHTQLRGQANALSSGGGCALNAGAPFDPTLLSTLSLICLCLFWQKYRYKTLRASRASRKPSPT